MRVKNFRASQSLPPKSFSHHDLKNKHKKKPHLLNMLNCFSTKSKISVLIMFARYRKYIIIIIIIFYKEGQRRDEAEITISI